MADLAEALDAALRARYRVAEVRTPITQRRGLIARMNQLEKAHTRAGDRPGAAGRRAATAAGIAPDTWTRWRNGQRQPSAASLRKLEGAYNRQITLPAFRKAIRTRRVPKEVHVTAVYQWSGSNSNQSDKNRTVKFTGMRPTMRRVVQAWVAAGPLAAADAFERGISLLHGVADTEDDPPRPGIQILGNRVTVHFPPEKD